MIFFFYMTFFCVCMFIIVATSAAWQHGCWWRCSSLASHNWNHCLLIDEHAKWSNIVCDEVWWKCVHFRGELRWHLLDSKLISLVRRRRLLFYMDSDPKEELHQRLCSVFIFKCVLWRLFGLQTSLGNITFSFYGQWNYVGRKKA